MFDFLPRNRFEIYEVRSAKRHVQVVLGLKLKRIAFPDNLKVCKMFFLRCDLELEINSEKDIAPVSRLISASQYPPVNAIIGLVLRQNIEKLTRKI